MRIEAVDLYYLSMPEVTDAGDGSQDALVVRVQADDHTGWGECEASPLVSIAAHVCPMSHGACQPVQASVLGQRLEGPEDVARMADLVTMQSMDLLQAAHTWSGIEMALWDILGRAQGVPVWRLLGYAQAWPKVPYASMLFGDDAQATLAGATAARAAGYRAINVGWGPYGRGTVAVAADHVMAAREGLGPEGILLVDAGQIWREDVAAAALRLPALQAAKVTWLEEPITGYALEAYAALAGQPGKARSGWPGARRRITPPWHGT